MKIYFGFYKDANYHSFWWFHFCFDANNVLQKLREKYWTINASNLSGSFESFARWRGGGGHSHLHRQHYGRRKESLKFSVLMAWWSTPLRISYLNKNIGTFFWTTINNKFEGVSINNSSLTNTNLTIFFFNLKIH